MEEKCIISELNGINEVSDMNEGNKINEVKDTNEVNDSTEGKDLNALNNSNAFNDSNEVMNTNEVKDTNEIKDINEIMNVNEVNDSNKINNSNEVINLNQVMHINEVVDTNEIKDTDEVNDLHQVMDISEVDDTNEIESIDEVNDLNEVNDFYEVNSSNEVNDINQVMDISEIKDINQVNDLNEVNSSNKINNSNEVNDTNEINDLNEGMDLNQINNLNKFNDINELSDMDSDISSPPCSPSSSLDLNENEITSRVSKRKSSVPYFLLPKPNLEDFLIETEKKLFTPEIKPIVSFSHKKIFEPKDTGIITFDIDEKRNSVAYTPLTHKKTLEPQDTDTITFHIDAESSSKSNTPVSHRKIFEPKDTGVITFDISAGKKLSTPLSLKKVGESSEENDIITFDVDAESNITPKSNALTSLYKKVKSINDVQDSTPGLKRSLLRDALRKQIEENKLAAFNRKKENERLNNEIDEELGFECDNEDKEVDCESSEDEDVEEATVSFDNNEETHESDNAQVVEDSLECSDDEKDSFEIVSKSKKDTELSNYSDDDSISEVGTNDIEPSESNEYQNDDEDRIIPIKSRKVKVLADDSDDDDDDDNDVHDEYASSESVAKSVLLKHPDSPTIADDYITEVERKYGANSSKTDIEEISAGTVSFASNILPASESIDKDPSAMENIDADDNGFTQSSSIDISSSIPSFQPNGGFVHHQPEADEEIDVAESIESKLLNVHKTYSLSRNEKEYSEDSNSSCSLQSLPIKNHSDDAKPAFDFSIDHPPVSQQANSSDLFSSQDIANICSGVFKSDAIHETMSTKDDDDDETDVPEFCDPEPDGNIKDFLEMEAELSGEDDDGIDDDSEDGDNGILADLVDDKELAHAEKLREDVANYYMKQKRDEDLQQINLIQEQIILDGELNTFGNARQRRFIWNNKNGLESSICDGNQSSDSSEDENDQSWTHMDRDRAKFLQEKAEDDMTELRPNYKKPNLKIQILGKPEFAKENKVSSLQSFSRKRSRNSYLNLDEESVSLITKKLKNAEETMGGSRTTKHVLFLSPSAPAMNSKKDSNNKAKDDNEKNKPSVSASVFNKLK